MCPIVGIGLVTSIVYMSALTYGTVAVCQFLGAKQGMAFLRGMRQSTFCLVVPLIPAVCTDGWKEYREFGFV